MKKIITAISLSFISFFCYAQSFNSILSEEILGSPNINRLPLEQPKSQPLNYVVPEPVNYNRQMENSNRNNYTPQNTNPVKDFINNFNSESSQSSINQTTTPTYTQSSDLAIKIRPDFINIDEDKLERLRNSPCWTSFGIELNESYETQLERYVKCENAKNAENNKVALNYFVSIFTILVIGGLVVFYGLNSKKKVEAIRD